MFSVLIKQVRIGRQQLLTVAHLLFEEVANLLFRVFLLNE